jgi:ligand-binding sensor domain-containing protein
MKIIIILSLSFISIYTAHAQQWELFGYDNYITGITTEGQSAWVATSGGLVKIDLESGEVIKFNKANSSIGVNALYSVTTGKKGIKYFGTHDYLGSYDGNLFKKLDLGITGTIMELYTDNSGVLWIGGNGVGLYKFDGENLTHFTPDNSGLPDYYVTSVVDDRKGNKWIGTYGGGVARYNDTTWTIYLPGQNIYDLALDSSGSIIISASSGLFKYNGFNWNQLFTNNFKANSVACDAEGNIWAGFFDNGGVAKYDSLGYTFYNSSNSNVKANTVRSLGLDHKGNILLGTSDGLMKKEGDDFILLPISNSPWLRWLHSLAFDDSANILWIGGQYQLTKYDGNDWKVYTSENSFLPEGFVYIYDILIDSRKKVWIGMGNKGLIVIDGAVWKLIDTSNSGLPDNNVFSISEDYCGNIWIGTYGGIAVYNPETSFWRIINQTNSPLPSDKINSIKHEGIIKWIATGNGLVRYDRENWEIYGTHNSTLKSNHISCIALIEDRNIWAGTSYEGGVTHFKGDTSYTFDYTNSPLTGHYINELHYEKRVLWIGSESGLYRLENNEWKTFDRDNSALSHNQVNSVISDNKGNKWIATWSGGLGPELVRYNESAPLTNSDEIVTARDFQLYQNYPNPFNPFTTIKFTLPQSENVKLSIYDILGNRITDLLDEVRAAGEYKIYYDATRLSSGVYIYRLSTGNNFSAKKFIVVK